MTEKTIKHKILNSLLLVVIFGVITFLLPMMIGLGAGGFDSSEALMKNSFYLNGAVFLIFVILALIYSKMETKGDEKYGSSILFNSPGEFPSSKLFKNISVLQLVLGSIIIFSVFGLFSAVTGQSFMVTGIGTIEQQFTPVGQMLYSTLLVPGSENAGLMLVIAVTLIGLGYIARKTNMSRANYVGYSILSVLSVSVLYWFINHTLRYAGQDLSLAGVAVFGLTMGVLTIFTGSFIPAWILHMMNNLFLQLKVFYDSDVIISVTVVVLIILSYLLYVVSKKKTKKRLEI